MIGIAEPCALQTYRELWLRIYDLFHIGHPGKSCSLPFLNFIELTLDLIVCTLRNAWVSLIWEVLICVEPVRMVYGRVSEPPEPQRGIGPTCCLYCVLFGHNHTHVRGLPVGII